MQRDDTKIPRVREYAEISLANGCVLTGYVFVEASSGIEAILNGTDKFFAVVDRDERVHYLNKDTVVQVRPLDA